MAQTSSHQQTDEAHTNGNGKLPRPRSWERIDLAPILDGGWVGPIPGLLLRTDNQGMLYPGKVHTFNGEPESLKSWCAQIATVQVIRDGGWVLYLDFEDTAESVVGRLLALGLTRQEVLERFDYRRVDEPMSVEAGVILDEALACRPSLVVLDGVTEAMGLLGLDPYSNPDVAKFWALLPRRCTQAQATVVLLDHVTKSTEQRGRWAIGAQHKLAAVDGAAFTFTTLKAFGHGKAGEAKIELAKDRPGHLRGAAAGKTIAHLKLNSFPDGGVSWSLDAVDTSEDGWRPTVLMERLSRYVEAHPGLSKVAVRDAVRGDDKGKRLALELLVTEGWVQATSGARGAHLLASERPFRAEPQEPVDA